MKAPQDIIIAPVITEKSMAGIATKKYTFKVACDANKIEIAKAIESLVPWHQGCQGKHHERSRQGQAHGYEPGLQI